MVSFFEMPILPLPFLNYKRNVKSKIGTQRKLPKIILQHSLTNHLKEKKFYKSLIQFEKIAL